jgi:hypothetical protein
MPIFYINVDILNNNRCGEDLKYVYNPENNALIPDGG